MPDFDYSVTIKIRTDVPLNDDWLRAIGDELETAENVVRDVLVNHSDLGYVVVEAHGPEALVA